MLFFLHIPKTAGSTLNYIIKNNFRERAQEVRWHWTTWITRQELVKKLTDKNCAEMKLIHGHFVYGVHELLGQEDGRYLTFVREPLKRAISGYFHIKRDSKSTFHRDYLHKTLEDYLLDSKILENDNGLVRRIAGIGSDVPFGQVNQIHFNQALDNLNERFLAVGLTEKFDLSIELFRKLGVFDKVYYWKQNISKNKSKDDYTLSSLVSDKFRANNSWDYALFEYCTEKFNKSIEDIKFSQASFNIRNRFYNLALTPKKISEKVRIFFKIRK